MTEPVPSNVCPVCDTPDGDHLDWCTPQAREQRPSKELTLIEHLIYCVNGCEFNGMPNTADACRKAIAEIERLQRQQNNLIAALGEAQAKLDEIMLATCSCPPYQAPEPPAEPTPRYQCMVKGCPGNHPSKWGVCDTRPYEAIAVWLDADGNFQWDFETNEDHPIDATIALARRTNWVMTDKGWRLAQPPGDVQA